VDAAATGHNVPRHWRQQNGTLAVAAVNIKLSNADIAYLEDPYQPHPILGHDQV
jgi:hypothetical protein